VRCNDAARVVQLTKELVMNFCKQLLVLLAAGLPLWAFAGPVNVNTADAETISAELKGIGLSKAKAIVEYRSKHGPFKSVDDLTLVTGIGEKTLDSVRSDILIEAPAKKK
jgi:competence protein ComEA